MDAAEHVETVAEDAKPGLPASPEPPKQYADSQVAELAQIGPDLLEQLKDLVNFKKWIGLEDKKLSPEQEAKAQLLHQGWLRLGAEEQQVAIAEKQRRDAQKQQQEEEAAQRKQAEEQANQGSFVVPTSKHTGPADAVTQVSQNRQQLSGPASAN